MNYIIVTDKKILTNFINWLPDLNENETYYCCLFARKKYCVDMIHTSDKTQLKRFTANKQNLFDKIKQLECSLGSYKLKDRIVPQEALALYIQPNPRDNVAATWDSISVLTTILRNQSKGFNPHQEVMSCIQRAKGRKIFVDFDIDTKENVPLEKLNEIFYTRLAYRVLETHGGYHILINTRLAGNNKEYTHYGYPENWYKAIQDNFECDKNGDQLLPVPGTYQGGFTPKFICP